MTVTYRGLPLVREASIEMHVSFTDPTGVEQFRAVQTEREVRLTLGEGVNWPDDVRRGRNVDFEMSVAGGLYRMTGRVRFRRLRVAVIDGRFERVTPTALRGAADKLGEAMG